MSFVAPLQGLRVDKFKLFEFRPLAHKVSKLIDEAGPRISNVPGGFFPIEMNVSAGFPAIGISNMLGVTFRKGQAM